MDKQKLNDSAIAEQAKGQAASVLADAYDGTRLYNMQAKPAAAMAALAQRTAGGDARVTPEFVAKAREALDSMDDYARMESGVAATGPVALLKSFIDVAAGEPVAEAAAQADDVPEVLVLLRMRVPLADGKHVHFVISKDQYSPTIAEQNEHDKFLYEEHTCPVNWLRAEVVTHGKDTDPHELFEHVQTIAMPQEVDLLNIGPEELGELFEKFQPDAAPTAQPTPKENAPTLADRGVDELPAQAVTSAAASVAQPTPPDDEIARAKRVMKAIDAYMDAPDRFKRTDVRIALTDEFAALRQPGALPEEPQSLREAVYMALHYYMKVQNPDEWAAADAAIAAMRKAGALLDGTEDAVIPDGWQLVPKKLTYKMKKAGRHYGFAEQGEKWDAMLAVAPTPPAARAAAATKEK